MIKSEELTDLVISINRVYGYDFSGYSRASFLRRVEHFMDLKNIKLYFALAEELLSDEELFEEFVQEVTVNVTEMFRDPLFYRSLKTKVFPRLATYPIIKVWIAGCSTGEELYSLAIMLREEGLLDRAIIYATDINQQALRKARQGIYRLEYMKGYTINYQKAGGESAFSDYYTARYKGALIDQSLKKNVLFSIHNLALDQSFNEFQLILCRNVLIYFNQELQNKVITLFYESLCPFGFLGLGSKESLLFSDKKPYFSEVDRQERIFCKKGYQE